jgi:hypothetical protein
MLYALETEPKPTMPCIGFNVEHAAKGKLSLTCWCECCYLLFYRSVLVRASLTALIRDVGGPDKIRPLWRHYFQVSRASWQSSSTASTRT